VEITEQDLGIGALGRLDVRNRLLLARQPVSHNLGW
jgi:hypothetical protein